MAILKIWVGQTHAATLEEAQNNFSLQYTEQWKQENGFAFSPHLPVNTTSTGAEVKHFFSNLLPEGQILEGLSQTIQVSKFDVFGLLKKVGKDCAGALIILEEEDTPTTIKEWHIDHYQHLEHEELNQRINDANAQDTPLIFWKNTPRMSLAGVQNKLGIYLDNQDRFYLPIDDAPTSHILKPESSDQTKHQWMSANEYFCMQLADAVGLNVPNTRYIKLPMPIYLIERYDRTWLPDGQLARSHQIDACQALNLPPSLKYKQEFDQAPLGASISDILSIASICSTPAKAQLEIIQWILFNYLIGNTDAHAKNISLIINQVVWNGKELTNQLGVRIAPLYDLVCGTVYGYKEFAQTIGGEAEISLIGKQEWKAFSSQTGIKFTALKLIAEQLIKKLDKTLALTAKRIAQETEAPIIKEIESIIQQHQSYLVESLLS